LSFIGPVLGNRGALQAGETGAGFEASSGGIEDDPARNAKAVTGGKQFKR
jgi:hypothetical protein